MCARSIKILGGFSILQDYLYTTTTVPDALGRYIEELNSSDDFDSKQHANKLMAYENMMKDKQFLRNSRKLFNSIYDLLDKKHPELHFSIAGRRKSLISTEKKIILYSALGSSLDSIRDFLAFRIILFGNSSLNLEKHCYDVIEEIIELATRKGFLPCERSNLINVVDINQHKNEFFSNFKYKKFVKDYICFPKENGYRSLHLVLVDTKGRHIEIQIRTLDMHAEIESNKSSDHNSYKQGQYPINFPLERERISIAGYSFKNGQVFDFAGVENPITIFQRQKTF